MKVGWQTCTIGELCDQGGGSVQTGPFGSQLHAEDYVTDGIPFVMPTNLGENRIIEDKIARISVADAERLSRYRLRTGDIIYGRRGDIGRRALVTKHQDGWICGSGCIRIRFGSAEVDPRFVSFYLGQSQIKDWILAKAVGSTMPNLNSEIIRSVPISLPPLPIQRRIADILGALDDKIECNRRINQTLEAMAQALYKHWFEDEDSRESPEEWKDSRVGDLCEFAYGKGLRETERIAGQYPVYGSAGIVGTHKDFLVQAPGLVVGRKGTIGRIHRARLPFFPIDTTFYIIPKAPEYSFDFLYLKFRQEFGQDVELSS